MTMFYTLAGCAEIPCPVFEIAHVIKNIIEIVVPVILIILGMIDFAKATMGHDEGEISKAKDAFIKRLLAAFSVFFVVFVLQLVFNIIADSADRGGEGQDGRSIWTCVDRIFKGVSEADKANGVCDNDPFSSQRIDTGN